MAARALLAKLLHRRKTSKQPDLVHETGVRCHWRLSLMAATAIIGWLSRWLFFKAETPWRGLRESAACLSRVVIWACGFRLITLDPLHDHADVAEGTRYARCHRRSHPQVL
jgi:hypothetical protein